MEKIWQDLARHKEKIWQDLAKHKEKIGRLGKTQGKKLEGLARLLEEP